MKHKPSRKFVFAASLFHTVSHPSFLRFPLLLRIVLYFVRNIMYKTNCLPHLPEVQEKGWPLHVFFCWQFCVGQLGRTIVLFTMPSQVHVLTEGMLWIRVGYQDLCHFVMALSSLSHCILQPCVVFYGRCPSYIFLSSSLALLDKVGTW